MPDFDLTGELSLKIELHMLRPITEKVHSGSGPVSLVPIGAGMSQQYLQLVPIKTLQSLHAESRVITESFETNLDCTMIKRD